MNQISKWKMVFSLSFINEEYTISIHNVRRAKMGNRDEEKYFQAQL